MDTVFCFHNQGGTARQALVPAIGMRAFLYAFLQLKEGLNDEKLNWVTNSQDVFTVF